MAIVTIKDIAKQLKLAPSTVSRALRDHPDISYSMSIKWNWRQGSSLCES